MLTEPLLLVVLACDLCWVEVVSFGLGWISRWSVTAQLSVQELVTVGAIILIGILWTRARVGVSLPSNVMARCVWAGVLVILALSIIGTVLTVSQDIPLLTPTFEP